MASIRGHDGVERKSSATVVPLKSVAYVPLGAGGVAGLAQEFSLEFLRWFLPLGAGDGLDPFGFGPGRSC